MKTDTQHLDYLISQYVDGCLDAASRKSLEQRLLNDPEARKLYKEQHDVQEMLDDWGNRIPMINWEQFDQELGMRLENETVGGRTVNFFRRWGRPMSIAAGLMVAASLGYGWHAISTRKPMVAMPTVPHVAPQVTKPGVAIEPLVTPSSASVARVQVDEQPGQPVSSVENSVAITPPGNMEGADSLKAGVQYGMTRLSDVAQAQAPGSSSVNVAQGPLNSSQPVNKDKDPIPPAYP
ncbi:MAG: anti-sigma factor family protein [Phycisphaerae bacterium]